jgi:trans-aconitate methyltransferase
MEFLEKMKELGLLHEEMDVLDVGAYNGAIIGRLANGHPGRTFDAIDVVDLLATTVKKIAYFEKISFVDYAPHKYYDLIFARNSFFHEEGSAKQAERYFNYLKPGGVMCVSFMGKNDPWADKDMGNFKYYSTTSEEVEAFKKLGQVLWFEEYASEYTNFDERVKKWHLYRLIIKKV